MKTDAQVFSKILANQIQKYIKKSHKLWSNGIHLERQMI